VVLLILMVLMIQYREISCGSNSSDISYNSTCNGALSNLMVLMVLMFCIVLVVLTDLIAWLVNLVLIVLNCFDGSSHSHDFGKCKFR